ncbi:MAG: hypothetical protein J0H15_09145 [Xanthomonadales bacterium]|nr:hypothetical protein [Xanthomonadales bacterium]
MRTGNLPFVAGLCCALLALAAGPAVVRAGSPLQQLGETAARVDVEGRRTPPPPSSLQPPPRSRGGVPADWQALGPFGGDVADVAASPIAPGVMLAAIASASGGGALYRSTDSGASWSAVAVASGYAVRAITFGTDGKAFLGTDDGLYSSTDDGASWLRHDLGIGLNQSVLAITIDPSNDQTLWVGVGEAFALQPANLVKSTNGGLTWTDVTPPHPAPMSGHAVAVHPSDPDTVIAAFGGDFGGGELWVSTDGGASWADRSAGLPPNPLRALDYDGVRLLVGGGQLFGSQYVGLYGSGNLGQNWIPLHSGWPLPVVTSITVDPNDWNTILVGIDGAGVNRSTDGGATWEMAVGGSGSMAVQAVRFRAGSSDAVLVGASSLGVYRSDDGGDAFTASSTGIAELPLWDIATSPTDPGQLAVAFQGNNNGGVFSSTDGGATWTTESLPPTRYSSVEFAPDGTLYAVSAGPSTIAPEGLYRRAGDGSWSGIGPDQGVYYESDLAPLLFSAADPGLIYAGGSDFGYAGDTSTIWRTTDAGATWAKVYMGDSGDRVSDIAFGSASGQHLVAGYDGSSAQAGGAVRSADGGNSWQLALDGIGSFARMPRLCTSAARPESVWLTYWETWGDGVLLRSDAEGRDWQRIWAGKPVKDLACDQEQPDVLYLALEAPEKVVRSADAGASFQPFGSGLATSGEATALALSASGPPRLYLSALHGSFVTERDGPAGDDVIFGDGFE